MEGKMDCAHAHSVLNKNLSMSQHKVKCVKKDYILGDRKICSCVATSTMN